MPAPQTVSEYRLAIDDLDRAILTLSARINAATYELLVLIREFDEPAGWLRWGFDNCTQWLLHLQAASSRIRRCSQFGLHHVRHWADGGETDVDNLALLCSRHHRLVHEGGYAIATDHQGRWYFRRPDGRAIPLHGYRPEDMIDDDIDASAEVSLQCEGASAEGCGFSGDTSVREPAALYCVSERTIAGAPSAELPDLPSHSQQAAPGGKRSAGQLNYCQPHRQRTAISRHCT